MYYIDYQTRLGLFKRVKRLNFQNFESAMVEAKELSRRKGNKDVRVREDAIDQVTGEDYKSLIAHIEDGHIVYLSGVEIF